MAIERFAPRPDAAERHRLVVDAPPAAVYRAIRRADLAASPLVRGLFLLRSLPALLLRREALADRHRPVRLETLLELGFGLLDEDPGRELVLGAAGRFWRPAGGLLPFDRALFEGPLPVGLARAVWSFAVSELAPGRTLLSTETRVVCADAAARRRFRAYWWLIRPWSGLIRRSMLRAIRRAALREPGRVGQGR